MVLNDYSMQAKFQVQIKSRLSRLDRGPVLSLLLLYFFFFTVFLHT